MKGIIEAELKELLDKEDRKKDGVIGETYSKLAEIHGDRRR